MGGVFDEEADMEVEENMGGVFDEEADMEVEESEEGVFDEEADMEVEESNEGMFDEEGDALEKKCKKAKAGKCLFPFRYKGEFYKQCTSVGHDTPWCATSYKEVVIEETGKKVQGYADEWSECECGGSGERAARAVNGGNVHPCNQPGDPRHIDLFNLVMISV